MADDKARQAAVDKRGYYTAEDQKYARQDPKIDRNFRSIEKARKTSKGRKPRGRQ